MKSSLLRGSVVLGILIVSCLSIGPSKVGAQTSPCFYYNSNWYQTHLTSTPKISTVASENTVTVVNNANPANLLQTIPFNGTCQDQAYPYTPFLFTPSHIVLSNGTNVLLKAGDLGPFNTDGLLSSLKVDFLSTQSGIVSNLDAITNEIATKGALTIRGVGPAGTSPVNVTVPMTNCVKIGGDGPIWITFMRTYNISIPTFIDELTMLQKTINSTQPYKKYSNQFSFYIDFRKYDGATIESSATVATQVEYEALKVRMHTAFDSTSCGSNQQEKIIINNDTSTPGFAIGGGHLSFISLSFLQIFLDYTNNKATRPQAILHEISHAFADLSDEYIRTELGLGSLIEAVSYHNCTSRPSSEFRNSTDNKIYGSVSTEGCMYLRSRDVTHPTKYYRPSSTSFMNTNDMVYFSPRFNVISCGYVVAAIHGEEPVKKNAEKYWPECKNIDTENSEIPPISPAPRINTVSGQSNLFTISGTGFTATDNAIKLTYVAPLAVTDPQPSSPWQNFVAAVGEALPLLKAGALDSVSHKQ